MYNKGQKFKSCTLETEIEYKYNVESKIQISDKQ